MSDRRTSSGGISTSSSASFKSAKEDPEFPEPGDAGSWSSDLSLSNRAVMYIFQARFEDAARLLENSGRSQKSASVSATQSMIYFTQALITYESGKVTEALDNWKRTEKLCAGEKGDLMEDTLEHRIILADAKICSTFLQFLQSADFGGLIKGSWALRQAWKLYQSTYSDIRKLVEVQTKEGRLNKFQMDSLLSNLPNGNPANIPSSQSAGTLSQHSETDGGAEEDIKIDPISPSAGQDLNYDRIRQLLGGVCYGFGCFHLMLSMLPANLIRWLKLLGFEGHMETGLQALTNCMHSSDSRALLARVTLVWFHTVIRTYYAVAEEQLTEGIEAACILLDGMWVDVRTSPIVQFFDCRLKRFKHDISGALHSYELSMTSPSPVKEINVLVHHELGILHFQMEQWDLAEPQLERCFADSRWGKSLYAYLLGITRVMLGKVESGLDLIDRAHKMNALKNAPLEMFIADRSTQLSKELRTKKGICLPLQDMQPLCALVGAEMTYLLNCPQYIPQSTRDKMSKRLAEMNNPKYLPLRHLMEGRLQVWQNQTASAFESFKLAVKSGEAQKSSAGCGEHVPAFACFEAGVLQCSSPESFDDGKKLLKKAGDSFKNCHFRNRLHVRVHLAQRYFDNLVKR